MRVAYWRCTRVRKSTVNSSAQLPLVLILTVGIFDAVQGLSLKRDLEHDSEHDSLSHLGGGGTREAVLSLKNATAYGIVGKRKRQKRPVDRVE